MKIKKTLVFEQDGQLYDLYNLPDGFVIKGDVNLRNMGLKKLPDLSKVIIEGGFDCSGNYLTDLKGAPQKIIGYFDCKNNKLTSLKGAPQEVVGDFMCDNNNLTSLEGAPKKVSLGFYCRNNKKLTSLYGAPLEVVSVLDCLGDKEFITVFAAHQKKFGGKLCCDDTIANEYGLDYSVNSRGGVTIDIKKLKESPRYIAETKAKELCRKVRRVIAAENVSQEQGVINPKRSDKDKKIIKAALEMAIGGNEGH